MLFKEKQLIILLVIFVQGVVSYSDMCRDAVVPPSKPRGVNQVDRTSSTPMFDLRVTPTQIQEGSGELKGYNIGVSIEGGKQFPFSEATLAVSRDGSCGSGDFDFRIGDYVEIVQDHEEKCPRLIQTKKKTHMTELLPLIWIPPSCGCVTLRILLIESGEIYYAENEGVTNGPLAKTFCFQREEPKQITREHRLDSLCHVIDRHSSSEILSRSQFRRHRGLESKHMDHLGIELALELRRNDAKACCRMIQLEEKMMCFDNARRRRIDQFCEDGIPDIPFKTFRKSHMRTLEKSCCFILGEFRYKCFETNSAISARLDDTTLFDYSMDASDMANDLAEFGSHEHLDSLLRPRQYRDDESNDDDDDDDDEEEDVWSEEEFDLEEDDDDDNDRELIQSPPSKPTVSPTDPKKLLRRKPNIRNSKMSSSERINNRRLSSTERKATRGGGSRRKSARRGSAERRSKNAGRRGSAERRGRIEGYGRVVRRNSAERRYSAERRGGTYTRRGSTERRTSAERRKSAERRTSAERRGSAERRERLRKVSRGTFDDRYTSTDRDSFYGQPRFDDTKTRDIERSKFTNARGGARQPMTVDEDLTMMPDRYGFDDERGSPMDRTLLKLQKRMKRIKLLNMCCQAGADMGRQVYGGIGSVKDECRHSSDKFVRGVNLGGKTIKCAGQFVDCCLEEAKKGLTMTSQEFIENSPVNYWDNPQQYDPKLVGQVLAQRGRRPALPPIPNSRKQKTQPKMYKELKTNYRTIPEERKSTPHQHVGSVKGENSTLNPLRTLPKTQDKDEIRSQQSTPNSNTVQSVSGVSNNQESSASDERNSTEKLGLGIPKKQFDKTEKRKPVVEDTRPGKDTEKPVLKRVAFVESKALPVVQQQNRKSSEAKRPIQNQRKEIRMEDFMDNVGDENLNKKSNNGGLSKANRQSTSDNSPKQKQQTDMPAKAELTDKPAKENIVSRKPTTETKMISKKSPSGHAIHDKDKVASYNKPRNSNLYESSTQSNITTSGQIVTREYFDEYRPTRKRGKQSRRIRFNSRSRGQRRRKVKGRVVALDSREMAERNTKQYMDALDSREMADQFISKNNKNRRWYRKNTRNYRYPMPYLGKHNRRTRFG